MPSQRQPPAFRVPVTKAVIDLFQERRILTSWTGRQRLVVGEFLLLSSETSLEAYTLLSARGEVPLGSGAFSYSNCPYTCQVSVGRYCSIAEGVRWGASAHPMEWASTSAFSYETRRLPAMMQYINDRQVTFKVNTFDNERRVISVGHDVWIGADAMIADGVTIGNGAVIGARALVLRDVPPYAIVAGVPARIIRTRFPQEKIERLLRSAWWRYPPEALSGWGLAAVDGFLDTLETDVEQGAVAPLDLPVLTGAEIIAASKAS